MLVCYTHIFHVCCAWSIYSSVAVTVLCYACISTWHACIIRTFVAQLNKCMESTYVALEVYNVIHALTPVAKTMYGALILPYIIVYFHIWYYITECASRCKDLFEN
jgi:hypothetical protein